MNLKATFQSGAVLTRTSDKPYTHAIRCDGDHPTWTTGGLLAAQKLADGMGYKREFVCWSGGRRKYRRGARFATPEIAEVTLA